MPVVYDSNKIIPAPFVNINKSYIKSGDDQLIGAEYSITLNGTIIPYKGSPTSSGTFWTNTGEPPDETILDESRQGTIQKKQEALRRLFSVEGRVLEFMPWDGTTPIKCNPRVASIDFEAGIWHDRCEYTITLNADDIIGYINPSGEDLFSQYIKSAEENWSLEFNDQAENLDLHQTFRLTHTLSAQGVRHFNVSAGLTMPAWQQARNWVSPRLGIDTDRILASGSMNLPAFMQGFNHVRSESVDEMGGIYGVIESWLIASGDALEEFTVETRSGTEDGLTHVSVNGTVTGLETRNSNFQVTKTKFTAASGTFTNVQNALLSRAQVYSNTSLNALPISQAIGRNPLNGVITYNVDYDTRPSTNIAGAKSEVISVTENNQGDVFAAIPVLGRTLGPVLQDIGTKTARQRSLSIEAVMTPVAGISTGVLLGFPDSSAIVSAVRPTTTQVFKESDQENWSATTGRYSRNITWTYE